MTPEKIIRKEYDIIETIYRINDEIWHREDGPAYILEHHNGNRRETWYYEGGGCTDMVDLQ